MRVGHGYDVHAFTQGDFIVLGGVKIKHDQALLAHSDGDVVLHAVCDALLGAAALGDIGEHFPDDDVRWKNADSRMLLRHVATLLDQKQYAVNNVDITIVAQAPKLAAYKPLMIENITQDLSLEAGAVNVKATTTEKLGYIGRKEGIAVHAICSLLDVKK